ncbi:hypothetical protein [Amycolatopsis alba]|uniref:Uncharacterized protein n=1 Tax=Amycolatopsis alba DSM 44262 TaxID=1125972 RepID=A0A229R9T8_AMYAL|nr:hypothetical protein [Amycolatopsis alba]OXM43407.1 hypothetical protein CFP75_38570 [Amycolatopsis alba DSM 44262]
MSSKGAVIGTSAAAAVLLVGGGVAAAITLSADDTPPVRPGLTAKGVVALSKDVHYSREQGRCFADNTQQPDIREGASVTVRDSADTIVAAGVLEFGAISPLNVSICEFRFRISGVPTGSKFFTVAVSGSNPATVSADDLFGPGVVLRPN